MPPNKQAYRKFRENYPLMEISFRRACAILASLLLGSVAGRLSGPIYWWSYLLALLVAILAYALLEAIWVIVHLPKLEFKDRRLDPVQRRKISEYLRQFPERRVRVVITKPAIVEDGAGFAANITCAIAGAWGILDRDSELAYEAENFDNELSPGHKFRIGVSVYGAKGDPEAKGILRDAFKAAKVDLYVDTSVEYEDRIIIVVGLRETGIV
jgi:hypothetical protein